VNGESVRKFLPGFLWVVHPHRLIHIIYLVSVVTMIVTESNQNHQHAFDMISTDHLQIPESTTPGIMMENTVSSGHREPELKIGKYALRIC
jgi:hypothetical protein